MSYLNNSYIPTTDYRIFAWFVYNLRDINYAENLVKAEDELTLLELWDR